MPLPSVICFNANKVHREGLGRENKLFISTPWSPPMPILSEKPYYRGRGKINGGSAFAIDIALLRSAGTV